MSTTPQFDSWAAGVHHWLRKPDEENLQLRRWLEGYDGPGLDRYTDGAQWLAEAVKDDTESKGRLVEAAGEMLDSVVDSKLKPVSDMGRQVDNVLLLCSLLKVPKKFAPKLLAAYEKFVDPVPDKKWLANSWQGIPVGARLRAALINNQSSDVLKPKWMGMLNRTYAGNLPSIPMAGFEGMLGLPSDPGKYTWGWCMKHLAMMLEGVQFKEAKLPRLMAMVEEVHDPVKTEWKVLAIDCDWPDWARKSVGADTQRFDFKYDGDQVKAPNLGERCVHLSAESQRLRDMIEPEIISNLRVLERQGSRNPRVRQEAIDAPLKRARKSLA